MPLWGKRKESPNDRIKVEDADVFLRRQCKYIGSFAVVLNKIDDRQRFVNEKLSEFKNAKKGIRVILQVTSEGIKILDESEKSVKMAHAIIRIAFSTCSLDSQLFAYVGRSLQKSMGYNLQAHVFRCKKQIHAQELAALVSKAFRIAFTKSTMRREVISKAFEEEVSKEKVDIKSGGRRWAKQELARGHELSEHAERARRKYGSPMNMRTQSFDSSLIHSDIQTSMSPPNARLASPKPRSTSLLLHNNASTPYSHPSPPEIGNNEKPPPLPARNHSHGAMRGEQVTPSHPVTDEKLDPSPVPYLNQTPKHSPVTPQNSVTSNGDNFFESSEGQNQESATPSNGNGSNWADFSCFDDKGGVKNGRKISAPAKLSGAITDEEVLQESEWYQGGLSRAIAEEILQGELPGAFLVRDSHSQPGFYALSIRVPDQVKQDGISNYLIEKLPDSFYRIMGFERSFETLPRLVAFYAVNELDLPVKLRLASNNPLFAVEEAEDEEDGDPDYEWYDSCESILFELEQRRDK